MMRHGPVCARDFGVSFPVFAKLAVHGGDADPLFQWLRPEQRGCFGDRIKWNFTKFLVARDGNVDRSLRPDDRPGAPDRRHRGGPRRLGGLGVLRQAELGPAGLRAPRST